MKKGFRNYNFEFDKNEKRIITAFCKQVIKQVQGNKDYYPIEKAFSSILQKIGEEVESVKLTKDEFFKMKDQLNENTRYLKEQIKKSWFIKRWILKPLLAQYSALYENHFKE